MPMRVRSHLLKEGSQFSNREFYEYLNDVRGSGEHDTATFRTSTLFAHCTPCTHSSGSITPRFFTTLNSPFLAWAMYMFSRR